MRFADLAYWPRQYAIGFGRLAQFNGTMVALQLTLCNLLGRRRLFQVELYGFRLWLRSGTPDLAVALDSLGVEFETVTGLPDPGGLIIDAGGYIGTAALKLAAAFPRSKIICLEPAVENLDILRTNVGHVPNIVVMQAALAGTEGEVTLHDAGSGEWGYSIIAGGARPHWPIAAVPTVTVESILAHEGCDRLFLLKLDVEGAEVEILAASQGWMDCTDILVAELHETLVPGAEAAFDRATRGRSNRRLPGEKILSVRQGAFAAPPLAERPLPD